MRLEKRSKLVVDFVKDRWVLVIDDDTAFSKRVKKLLRHYDVHDSKYQYIKDGSELENDIKEKEPAIIFISYKILKDFRDEVLTQLNQLSDQASKSLVIFVRGNNESINELGADFKDNFCVIEKNFYDREIKDVLEAKVCELGGMSTEVSHVELIKNFIQNNQLDLALQEIKKRIKINQSKNIDDKRIYSLYKKVIKKIKEDNIQKVQSKDEFFSPQKNQFLPADDHEKLRVLEHLNTLEEPGISVWRDQIDQRVLTHISSVDEENFKIFIENNEKVSEHLGKTCSFCFKMDDFIFYSKGKLEKQGEQLLLLAQSDFFKKDRRQEMRLNIDFMGQDVVLCHMNFKNQNVDFIVGDISMTGFSLSINKEESKFFKKGNIVEDFSLNFPGNDNVHVQSAEVIYINKLTSPSGGIKVGFRFIGDPLSKGFEKEDTEVQSTEGSKKDISFDIFDLKIDQLFGKKIECDEATLRELEELDGILPSDDGTNIIYTNKENGEKISLEVVLMRISLLGDDEIFTDNELRFEDLDNKLMLVRSPQKKNFNTFNKIKLFVEYADHKEEFLLDCSFKEVEQLSTGEAIVIYELSDDGAERIKDFFDVHQERQENIESFMKNATGTD